ncbi:MAG: hypothetical protein AAFY24_10455 [Pseudomonadota bacterium]
MTGLREPGDGVDNLLTKCMKVKAGETALIVCEDPALGWYDAAASGMVRTALEKIGCRVSLIKVGGPDQPLPAHYEHDLAAHDVIVYLARVGDQDRFTDKLPGKTVAMLYVRDENSLTSAYAATDHDAMVALKTAVDAVSRASERVTISCPMGTRLEGLVEMEDDTDGEVAVKRFPLCVPQPVLTRAISGQVALARWLTPTGSRSYSPAAARIDGIVMAQVDHGRIAGFKGDADSVRAIEQHYQMVSDRFDLDKHAIHSWHAGIHPACFFDGNIDDDPDRWSNNIFGNPRFLHFHTCGRTPPGEICWMVLDPTISFDGTPLWLEGRLQPHNFPQTGAAVRNWPELSELLSEEPRPVGL